MKYEKLTINHPMMDLVKTALDIALDQAVAAARDMATATLTLKLDIVADDDGIADLEEAPKSLMPIEYTCSVSTKRKVLNQTGNTEMLMAKQTKDGFYIAKMLDDQISLFEGGGE